MSRAPLPADLLLAAYNGVMACVWCSNAHRHEIAGALAIAHGIAAALPWFLPPPRASRLAGRTGSGGPAVLRDAYPLLALVFFWTELGWLQEVRQARLNDDIVAGWDLALFGAHAHSAWKDLAPSRWVSEVMHGAYFIYYALIALPPMIALACGRREAFRDMVLRLMATYLTCYIMYVAFPVAGPSAFRGGPADIEPGFFQGLIASIRKAGDSVGTAFPSSHVAGAVTIAWIGCRWFGRPLGGLLIAKAFLVLLATIYTQNHFAIDAVAGAVWGIAVQALVAPAFVRAAGTRDGPANRVLEVPVGVGRADSEAA